jgi:hypothetical protein
VQLGIRRQFVSVKIFFWGNKLNEAVIVDFLLFEAKNFDLSIIGDEKILRVDTNVSLRVVVEDVLDLCSGNGLVVLEPHNVEPLSFMISFIELEHKLVIEDVPTYNIIYEIKMIIIHAEKMSTTYTRGSSQRQFFRLCCILEEGNLP